jgi:hypothetical protein
LPFEKRDHFSKRGLSARTGLGPPKNFLLFLREVFIFGAVLENEYYLGWHHEKK